MEFLEGLSRTGHLTMFEQLDGTLRLDLREGSEIDSWMVVVRHGDVEVSHGKQDSDCVITTDRVFFDRIVDGEANALSALLRGMIRIEGSLRLALSLGRALPGPPQSRWRGLPRAEFGAGGPDRAPAKAAARARHGAHRAQAGKDRRR